MGRPKTPLAAWVKEQRVRLGWKSEELAARLSVSDATVRGWEAGRTIGAANREAMERLFDREAPGHETSAPDVGTLVVAIEAQTEAISGLVDLLRPLAEAQALQVADLQRTVQRLLSERGMPTAQELPAPRDAGE